MHDMDDTAHIHIDESEEASNQLDEELMAALDGPDVDPTQFRWTDAGNALLFVAMFGENVRYVEAWRSWAHWNGSRWEIVSNAALLPLAFQATEHMFAWASTLPEEQRAALRKHALATQKEQRLYAMLNLAKGVASIRAEPSLFDADPWLLGCESSTLNLRTKQQFAPRREDFITKSTGVVADKDSECPNWLATLDWALNGDAETIEHLQRIAGYMLTGHVSEEKLFAYFGGANGKTTIAMTLARTGSLISRVWRTSIYLVRSATPGAITIMSNTQTDHDLYQRMTKFYPIIPFQTSALVYP
jgi:phage/plasmid-associated DNA primase